MQSFRRSFLPGFGVAGSASPRARGAFGARVQIVARADEPGSGRVSGARTLKELPRWPLAALASAARAIAVAIAVAAIVAVAAVVLPATAAERPVRIVALGDSLTAGYGLAADAAFPARLDKALAAKGLPVTVANAGVSGDTASGGLARLDWSVPEGTEAVIVALGANDMLRGVDPKVTRKALEEIVRRLKARRIEVLLAGMRAAPNLGADYGREFEAIYSDLAKSYDLLLYPFFLDGVAADASFNQRDGLHPSAAGVDRIVAGILPKAEQLVARVREKRGP
jgi:acyl-CoA thioesterase-1